MAQCNHDCSSCSADCSSRKQSKEDFLIEEYENIIEQIPEKESKSYLATENFSENLDKISDIKKYQITLQNLDINIDYPKP